MVCNFNGGMYECSYGLGSIKFTFLYRRAYRTTSTRGSIYNYVKKHAKSLCHAVVSF